MSCLRAQPAVPLVSRETLENGRLRKVIHTFENNATRPLAITTNTGEIVYEYFHSFYKYVPVPTAAAALSRPSWLAVLEAYVNATKEISRGKLMRRRTRTSGQGT